MRKNLQSTDTNKSKYVYSTIIYLLLIAGIMDAGYISILYVTDSLPFYTLSDYVNCGNVLRSQYSSPFGIPLAIIALIHYILVAFFYINSCQIRELKWKQFLFWQTAVGLIGALYELYLQFGVIKSVCGYVFFAIGINIVLYLLVRAQFRQEHRDFRAYKKMLFAKYILNRGLKADSVQKPSPKKRIRLRK